MNIQKSKDASWTQSIRNQHDRRRVSLSRVVQAFRISEFAQTRAVRGQPSAANDIAYYGGMAIGFGTAAYQNRAAIGAVAEAGLEMARGAMVAAI